MKLFRFAALALVLALLSGPLLAQDENSPEKDDQQQQSPKGLPLKAASKVEFTTDEGTWMSLDISSDGKTVVFDLLGDIYTVPAAGGEARRIVGGIAFDSQPRFAPDG